MNFKNSPQTHKEKEASSPHYFLSSQLSSSNKSCNSNSRANKHVEPPSPVLPARCCRGFSNVKSNAACGGANPSTSQQNNQQLDELYQRLESKIENLEKEVEKQRELRVMYKKRMERTQDYLRYCLEIAQDNGILDLIVHYKGELEQSPQIPNPAQHHPDLAAIIDQAKINGWCIDPDEIELEEKIGQGSTAEIYMGSWRGFKVAVKCIFAEFFGSNEDGMVLFAQEVDTLSKQRHRFVLQLMGACMNPPHCAWVVTEFLSTNLKDWLHGPGTRNKERVVPLPPFKERVIRALEIAQGMQYLHEQKPKVIHRDLKPSNIFLDDALHVRVADFGHARFLADHEMALTGETGTYVYMAPEVIKCEPYNEKCDVYSFGVILNELLTGQYPYIETEYGPKKIATQVVECKLRPMLPCDDDVGQMGVLINLIRLCWDANPSTRPSFTTITRTLECYVKNLALSN